MADGTDTDNGKETMELLLQPHFIDSVNISNRGHFYDTRKSLLSLSFGIGNDPGDFYILHQSSGGDGSFRGLSV